MSGYDPEIPPTQRGRSRDAERGSRWARRLLGVAVFIAGVAAIFAVVAVSLHLKLPFGINQTTSQDSTTTTDGTGGHPAKRAHHPSSLKVRVSTLAALLTPAYRIAAVPFGSGGALFLGGYTGAGAGAGATPTDAMQTLSGASVQDSGTLPAAEASAVAAALGPSIYLFGGEGSTIYQISPTGATVVGSLPSATADAAIAVVGNTAYIIGGYDGAAELNTIVEYTPGGTSQVVATLPTTLRFPAATTFDHEVYIAGGESNGVGSAIVYRFDPLTKIVSEFAHLPKARDREAAGSIGGRVIVMGGEDVTSGARTRAIYVINPHTAAVHLGGLLPVPLSDLAAIDGPGEVIAAGGIDGAGAASSAVYAIRVRR